MDANIAILLLPFVNSFLESSFGLMLFPRTANSLMRMRIHYKTTKKFECGIFFQLADLYPFKLITLNKCNLKLLRHQSFKVIEQTTIITGLV